MISIIIPAYNAARTISRCLDSIAKQTYRDVEVTIVDDCSSFPLQRPELSSALGSEEGVRVIHNERNMGAPASRNIGFRASRGEYVMFCDADIVLVPTALERLLDTLQKRPDASYAYSSFRFGWKKFPSFPFDAARLRAMPYIHTTSLIRREHFPGFDETIKRFQDWDLYLTMLEQGHTGVWVPEVLFSVINTSGTMSRWLPSFVYKIPWLPSVKRYRAAEVLIRQKHHLD